MSGVRDVLVTILCTATILIGLYDLYTLAPLGV
jgi:hypothetical protein